MVVKYSTEQEEAFDPDQNAIVEKDFFTLKNNDRLLLDVQELNSLFKVNGNFDIEVYKIHEFTVVENEQSVKKNSIEKLSFINEGSSFASSLAAQTDPDIFVRRLRGTEEEIEQNFPKLSDNFVEYLSLIHI